MDPLTHLLGGLRAQGAFTLRAQFDPPWGLSVRDGAALTVIATLTGRATLCHGGSEEQLQAGDLALVQGTQPYVVSDAHGSAPTVRILPDNRCVDLEGRPIAESMSHGLRTWGNASSGTDALLIGVYQSVGEVGRLLTRALPAALVVRGENQVSDVVALMEREIAWDGPGQLSLLDRLLDVVLVGTVRSYAARSNGSLLSWLTTPDTVVGTALELMHERLAHGWTLDSLARAANASRATLTRRFTAEIGRPPISYLTSLRLATAADLLRTSEATLAAVAHEVGYATPFALSTAFKRQFGLSPRSYRAHALARPST